MKKAASNTVLTFLYIQVIARTFASDAPPLSFTSLLLAALTLIVVGHLANVFDIGTQLDEYPLRLMTFDLILVALFSLVFQLLAHPLAGGVPDLGQLVGITASTVTPEDIEGAISIASHRAFLILIISVCPLAAWHLLTPSTFQPSKKKLLVLGLGWALYTGLATAGFALTDQPRLNGSSLWKLTCLARAAVILSAVFVLTASDLYKTAATAPSHASS